VANCAAWVALVGKATRRPLIVEEFGRGAIMADTPAEVGSRATIADVGLVANPAARVAEFGRVATAAPRAVEVGRTPPWPMWEV